MRKPSTEELNAMLPRTFSSETYAASSDMAMKLVPAPHGAETQPGACTLYLGIALGCILLPAWVAVPFYAPEMTGLWLIWGLSGLPLAVAFLGPIAVYWYRLNYQPRWVVDIHRGELSVDRPEPRSFSIDRILGVQVLFGWRGGAGERALVGELNFVYQPGDADAPERHVMLHSMSVKGLRSLGRGLADALGVAFVENELDEHPGSVPGRAGI